MSYAPAIEALERELAAVEARAASLREAIAVLDRLRQHLINIRASGAEQVTVAGICDGLGLTGHECGKALWVLAEEKVVVLHTSGARATVDITGIGAAA